MAHKTLINGTAYEISGGKTLISGTSYAVKNGKVLVDGTEYDISFFVPPVVLDLWSSSGSTAGAEICCIVHSNGYWVVGGYRGATSPFSGCIAYATSLNGPWTVKDIWQSGAVNCITYADGYWVVGGKYDNTAYIAYATNIDGDWNTDSIVANTNTYVSCIAYGAGKWVVGINRDTRSTDYATIAYSTNLSGTWTPKDLWMSSYECSIDCITYADGYWVIGGERATSSTYYARIAYATSLSGTWTTKDLWTASGTAFIYCITYAAGYWVAGGYAASSSGINARIAYSTSLSGTWTGKNIWSGKSYRSHINCIAYADGYWTVGGVHYDSTSEDHFGRMAYATSLDGPWTIQNLWGGGSNDRERIRCVINADGYWVFGGRHRDSADKARIAFCPTLDGFNKI
jgi:hypothetical protein